jgi:hypothetical protein
MAAVIFGIVVLALLLVVLNGFSKANPRTVAVVLKATGGVGALGGAALFAARGQRTNKRSGQISRVRSAFVEMELDHDTGAMRGIILAGKHEGQSLDALDVETLAGLLPEIDEESRALLMAYLDRRAPRWRENTQSGSAAGESTPPWSSGKMTEEEAYQILGLKPGATAEEIGHAHRTLMKKLHPDQGGSTYLAARVNEAKDVLLRRHR